MANVRWTNIDPALKKSLDEANDAEKNYIRHEIGRLAQQINDNDWPDSQQELLISLLKNRRSTQAQIQEPDDYRRKLPKDVQEILAKEERLSADSKLSIEEQLNKVFGLPSKSVFDE
jgi:hypothetical protein